MLAATSLLPALNRATGGRFPPLFVTAETWLVAWASPWRWRSPSACRRRCAGAARSRASRDRGRAGRRPWWLWRQGGRWGRLNQIVQITFITCAPSRSVSARRWWSWSASPAWSACWYRCWRCQRASAHAGQHRAPDRVIMLRAGSDAELSSGVPRDQATLLMPSPASRATPGDGRSPRPSWW